MVIWYNLVDYFQTSNIINFTLYPRAGQMKKMTHGAFATGSIFRVNRGFAGQTQLNLIEQIPKILYISYKIRCQEMGVKSRKLGILGY